MESNSKNLRDIESVQLSDTITAIDSSGEHVAVGCLDNSICKPTLINIYTI